MANQRRLERINSMMRRIISENVLFRLRDPRIGFVTITRVSVSPDLSEAKVYFSVLGNEEDIRTTTRGLKSASGEVRSVVAREMDLRTVPRLTFQYDPSLREQAEIDRILRQDRLAREGGAEPAAGAKTSRRKAGKAAPAETAEPVAAKDAGAAEASPAEDDSGTEPEDADDGDADDEE
ncbi:MAG: 30S ribosome-binding factor RbfA [Planctomycetota bacterium]